MEWVAVAGVTATSGTVSGTAESLAPFATKYRRWPGPPAESPPAEAVLSMTYPAS